MSWEWMGKAAGAAGGFLTGGGGIAIAAFLAGSAVGAWTNSTLKDAGQASGYRADIQATAVALTVLVKNGGRREMNYIGREEAFGQQCRAAIEALRDYGSLTVEAQQKAAADATALQKRLRDSMAANAALLAAYGGGDATTGKWMSDGVPDDVVRLRYHQDKPCAPDLFSKAGYPYPAGDKCAVAQPAGKSGASPPK